MKGLQGAVHIILTAGIAYTVYLFYAFRGQVQQNNDISYLIGAEGSSVWCWGNNHTNRMCRFKNLCYQTQLRKFFFFHGPYSAYYDLPADRFSPTLLELSSVENHNGNYFNFVDVSAEKAKSLLSNIRLIEETSILFNRFHPDNLMHVFHDDLLPIYHSLKSTLLLKTGVDREKGKVRLVTFDTYGDGAFPELYTLFSDREPLSRSTLETDGGTVCFQDALVGLLKNTTWYQYGFSEPQGPIHGHSVSAAEIKQFAMYFRDKLNIVIGKTSDGPVVLLTRKMTRLVVNELELTLSLARGLNKKVVLVGTETHSVKDMIAVIGQASVLIGMHGSLFILSVFLPSEAVIIELFPYAVNPDHYTPYRTLASIMGITYRSWSNMDPTKTKTYPDRQPELGGIVHLPQPQQITILQSSVVPPHLCCSDPEWLFRIFQDTIIDIPTVIALTKSAVTDSAANGKNADSSAEMIVKNMYPAHVRKVSCKPGASGPSVELSWEGPFNLAFVDFDTVKYEVWLQEVGQEQYTAWMISKTHYTFDKHLKIQTSYNVWIRCILNDSVVGPFNTEQVTCVSS